MKPVLINALEPDPRHALLSREGGVSVAREEIGPYAETPRLLQDE